MYQKKTKIVCTLGPSSDSATEIHELISAGMNIARLNFSHGSHKDHSKILKNIRKEEKKCKKIIGVLQDLQGPKIRIGKMPDQGIEVKKGEKIKLTIDEIEGFKNKKETIIPVQYKNIIKDVKKNDRLLIDDGLIEIIVEKKLRNKLFCKVKVGGIIKRKKGINIPTATISAPSITEKDKEDLKWGLKNNVDYIALSFVRKADDIKQLRKLIQNKKKNIKIVAKIETHKAIENLEEIIKEADAIMVARGDLGIEIPAETVPIIQKKMIRIANKYGKPVITATQVLQSMVKNARATRAEISDAANAIFDNTDAIMLSNESAIGKYAQAAVATLKKVALTVENEIQKHEEIINLLKKQRHNQNINPICRNACELAIDSNADAIVVYTNNGYTAREIAKHRLYIPIITITPSEKTARELTLVWGLNTILIKKISGKSTKKTDKIVKILKKAKLIKENQKIIIICNANQKEELISTYNT